MTQPKDLDARLREVLEDYAGGRNHIEVFDMKLDTEPIFTRGEDWNRPLMDRLGLGKMSDDDIEEYLNDEDLVALDVDIHVDHEEHDPGNRMTPPSEGYVDITKIIITSKAKGDKFKGIDLLPFMTEKQMKRLAEKVYLDHFD